jgi:hypothetical protein
MMDAGRASMMIDDTRLLPELAVVGPHGVCDMNEDNRGPRRWCTFKRRYVVLLIVVMVAALLGLYLATREDGVERRLAVLRAAGYPTSFAELAEYTKLPEGAQNAAEVYARAFAAFVPLADEANVPLLGHVDLPERGVPLPAATNKAVAKFLTANEECLSLLHEAGCIEDCRYDWDYADVLKPQRIPPHTDALKRCSLLLELRTIFCSPTADNGTALACIQDQLRLGDSLRREPGLVGYMMRIAVRGAALHGLERALSVTMFTDEQLTRLDQMLATSAATLDLKEALITERCLAIEKFRDLRRSGSPSLRRLLRTGGILNWVPGIRARGLPDTLDWMEKYVQAADLPLRERMARFRELENELDQLSLLHAVAQGWVPVFTGGDRLFELDPRMQVHCDLARTALAIERFRLPTDELPARLEELVPRYLPQVPIDPFDGRPIRYRRRQTGYLLYSVGVDGRDNDGREQDEVNSGEPYDLCFVVIR